MDIRTAQYLNLHFNMLLLNPEESASLKKLYKDLHFNMLLLNPQELDALVRAFQIYISLLCQVLDTYFSQ